MIRAPRNFTPFLTKVLALATLAASGCGPSPVMSSYQAEDRDESFMQANFVRIFSVHVPERRELGPAAPLVLAFHGTGQDAAGLRALTGLDAAADREGFIVVYLQAAMGSWDVFDDLGFLGLDEVGYVREVIDRVGRSNVIDRHRIIAVGLSNGGVFSQQLGCKLADRIAGFVSVAASMPRLMAAECTPNRPISALYILGTVDGFFPVAGSSTVLSTDSTVGYWAGANRCSGTRLRSALPDREDDGTTVYRGQYFFCKDATRTEVDSIVGGGHAWPGSVFPAPELFGPTSRDISANAEIARFLENLPRR